MAMPSHMEEFLERKKNEFESSGLTAQDVHAAMEVCDDLRAKQIAERRITDNWHSSFRKLTGLSVVAAAYAFNIAGVQVTNPETGERITVTKENENARTRI